MHPDVLGDLGEASRRAVVDLVGGIGIEIARRIVAHAGEVDDRVDPGEMLRAGVAHVDPELDVGLRHLCAEDAGLEQHAVHADHLVAACLEHRHEDGSDVAVVTGDEDLHDQTFQGALPDSQSFSSMTLSRIVSMHAQKSVC